MPRRVARFAAAVEPPRLERLGRAELLRMAEAGREMLEIDRVLAKTGDNVVGELLRGQETFYEWDHYPSGDVFDEESGSQYYYHAHAADERFEREHGHFHTFVRPKQAPGPGPAAAAGTLSGPARRERERPWRDLLCHLVAVSMNAEGKPFRLFTVNRWVTGESWYPAAEAIRELDSFAIELGRPSWPTNRWIGACLRLFRPQAIALIEARDRVLKSWRERYPGRDVLEDRQLEIISVMDVSLERQVGAIQTALAAKSRPRRSG